MPYVLEASALLSAVVELLRARKERRLAEVLARSQATLLPLAERWTMGAREVAAYHVSLVVSAEDFVLLHGSAEDLELLREVFGAAIRTPETELAELYVVLALPPMGESFAYAYRHAPRMEEEAPSADSVLAGAARLLRARGDGVGAGILERAAIEQSVAVGSVRSMRRYLVRLRAEDLARVERDSLLADGMLKAVRDAAMTASDPMSAVVFGVLLGE